MKKKLKKMQNIKEEEEDTNENYAYDNYNTL